MSARFNFALNLIRLQNLTSEIMRVDIFMSYNLLFCFHEKRSKTTTKLFPVSAARSTASQRLSKTVASWSMLWRQLFLCYVSYTAPRQFTATTLKQAI